MTKPEIDDDGRETFTVKLLPRHAEWIKNYSRLTDGGDTAKGLERIVRGTYAADPTKAGTVRADGSKPQ